jgi:hypothetical protein
MAPLDVQIVLTCKYNKGKGVSFGQTRVNMILE